LQADDLASANSGGVRADKKIVPGFLLVKQAPSDQIAGTPARTSAGSIKWGGNHE